MKNKENEISIIKEILDQIKPYINMDGGDIEFVKYEDDYVYIKLDGACNGCDLIDYTLNDNIYESIKEKIPTCKGVLNINI